MLSKIKPLVSIIVPVYNVAEYLPECMDSLVHQSYDKTEIICINDGSTDASLTILERYQKRYPNIQVVSTENAGVAAARNLGLTLAKGEFIMFMDSDDWLDLNALEIICDEGFLTNPSLDVICFGACRVRNGVRAHYRSFSKTQISPISDAMALTINAEAWGKIYRQSFLKTHHLHFPVGLYYEDLTFHWSWISYAQSIAMLNQVFYNYRVRANSIMGISNKKKPGMAIHHLYNLKNIYNVWNKNGYIKQHAALFSIIFEIYIEEAYKYLHEKDKENFVSALKSLAQETNVKPKRISLTYDLLHDKPILRFKYRWARSIRKRLIALGLAKK